MNFLFKCFYSVDPTEAWGHVKLVDLELVSSFYMAISVIQLNLTEMFIPGYIQNRTLYTHIWFMTDISATPQFMEWFFGCALLWCWTLQYMVQLYNSSHSKFPIVMNSKCTIIHLSGFFGLWSSQYWIGPIAVGIFYTKRVIRNTIFHSGEVRKLLLLARSQWLDAIHLSL